MPMTETLQIHTIVSEPFAENTYVVWLPGRSDVLVIDPGLEPDRILDFLREEAKTVVAILCTHGHGDHIAGNAPLKEQFPNAPLLIGAGDANMLSDPWANLSASFGLSVLSPPADRLLREGDEVEAAGVRFEVLQTPGHSPGHVAFVYRSSPLLVFDGDVLLRESIGRSDFPGSNAQDLLETIRTKFFVLPDDTVLYPGHGPVTTVGHEKRANPFVMCE